MAPDGQGVRRSHLESLHSVGWETWEDSASYTGHLWAVAWSLCHRSDEMMNISSTGNLVTKQLAETTVFCVQQMCAVPAVSWAYVRFAGCQNLKTTAFKHITCSNSVQISKIVVGTAFVQSIPESFCRLLYRGFPSEYFQKERHFAFNSLPAGQRQSRCSPF